MRPGSGDKIVVALLRPHVLRRMDGLYGGLAADDFVVLPEHQAMVYAQAVRLDLALAAEHSSNRP